MGSMSYQVIARKYRPGTFASVRGQDHVTRTLANAISRKRVAHVYLFCGLRGVGKTSVARIFAKALNCLNPDGVEPCLECENCRDITQGRSLAVLEVDGASHNSVDNVRELTESVRSTPPPAYAYKLYIIDEVHMLSTAAFNALLKTLEEPPPNTVFILATTESHKVPDTVLSRCQRFDFRGLRLEEIQASLQSILEKESIPYEAEALRLLARLAEGSLRDAQSLLERVLAYSLEGIQSCAVQEALGAVTDEDMYALSRAIFSGQASEALSCVADIFQKGIDPGILLRHFVAHWRDILLVHIGQSQKEGSQAERRNLNELGLAEERLQDLRKFSEAKSSHDIQDLVYLARTGAERALQSQFPQYAFESLVVRLATRMPVRELQESLEKLREGLAREITPAKKISSSAPAQDAAKGIAQEAIHPPASNEFSQAKFAQFLTGKVSPVLQEHIKRTRFTLVGPQCIHMQGPELAIQYIAEEQTQKILQEKLQEFSGEGNWEITIQSVGAKKGMVSGSLLGRELEEKRNLLQEKKSHLENHPAIQSLRKAFPGSTIEKLRMKQSGGE